MAQGPRGTTSSIDEPARVGGLLLKSDSFGHLFLHAKPRAGKYCQRPSHQRSKRLHGMPSRSGHIASTCLCRSLLLLLYSLPLVPLPPPCPRVQNHHLPRAVLTRLRLARLCLVYGRPSSSVDPKGRKYVSFLSGHNQPWGVLGQTARHRFPLAAALRQLRSSSPAGLDRVRKGSKFGEVRPVPSRLTDPSHELLPVPRCFVVPLALMYRG